MEVPKTGKVWVDAAEEGVVGGVVPSDQIAGREVLTAGKVGLFRRRDVDKFVE